MIGIFGGTFDPIHDGHLHFAREACRLLKLEKLILVPAARNPLRDETTASASARLEMVNRAIQDCGDSTLIVSDFEVRREGPSYTIDTVEALSQQYKGPFALLMGSEVFETLPRWKTPQKLLEKVNVVVVIRPGGNPPSLEAYPKARVQVLKLEARDLSSTEIRKKLSKLPASAWTQVEPPLPVSPSVWQYIREHSLYRARS